MEKAGEGSYRHNNYEEAAESVAVGEETWGVVCRRLGEGEGDSWQLMVQWREGLFCSCISSSKKEADGDHRPRAASPANAGSFLASS